MSQPIYVIPRTLAIAAVEDAGRSYSGLSFGGGTPAEVIAALTGVPLRAAPDLIDVPRAVNVLRGAHTTKLLASANDGLIKAERAIKTGRIEVRP